VRALFCKAGLFPLRVTGTAVGIHHFAGVLRNNAQFFGEQGCASNDACLRRQMWRAAWGKNGVGRSCARLSSFGGGVFCVIPMCFVSASVCMDPRSVRRATVDGQNLAPPHHVVSFGWVLLLGCDVFSPLSTPPSSMLAVIIGRHGVMQDCVHSNGGRLSRSAGDNIKSRGHRGSFCAIVVFENPV